MQSNESLARLLADQLAWAGTERPCPSLTDSVAHLADKFGSHRLVKYVDGIIVSAIQVVVNRQGAILANVFTDANHRRQGYATELYMFACRLWPNLDISQDRSDDGENWVAGLLF